MADPTSIEEWLRRLGIPWLVGREVGAADVGAYGSVLDSHVLLTKYAVQARMPELAPADALPYISSDRGLIQGGTVAGPVETNAAFGTRLKEAWDVWPYAGTPLGILLQLYFSLGYENVYLVQQNGLVFTLDTPPDFPPLTDYLIISDAMSLEDDAQPAPEARRGFPWFARTIPAGTPWWRFADKTDLCNRFVLLFPAPLPSGWTSIVNPPTTSSEPSISEVNLIFEIVKRWKSAESQCLGAIVQTSGLLWSFPVTQVWGAGTGNWGGTTVFFTP